MGLLLPLASSCAPSILPLILCRARPVTRPRPLRTTPGINRKPGSVARARVGRNWASHLPLPSTSSPTLSRRSSLTYRCRDSPPTTVNFTLTATLLHHAMPGESALSGNEAMRTRAASVFAGDAGGCSILSFGTAAIEALVGHQLQRHTNDGTVSLRPFAAACTHLHSSPSRPCLSVLAPVTPTPSPPAPCTITTCISAEERVPRPLLLTDVTVRLVRRLQSEADGLHQGVGEAIPRRLARELH